MEWTIDASTMMLDSASFEKLPWQQVFSEMEQLEAGSLANTDEGRQVGHYWLRAPLRAPTVGQASAIGETTAAVNAFAEAVCNGRTTSEDGSPFTDVLHIGIGGSSLGPALLVDALADAGLKVHFLDNTDPDGIARILGRVSLRTTLCVIVTKSGTTAETRNGMLLVRQALQDEGLELPAHLVAITCEGSLLDQLAKKERWLRIFPMWDWVGGRYSLTSAVGLLTAGLAGIDVRALIRGAREMDEWTRTTDWKNNPAALLAGCWYLIGAGRGERALVVLPYSDRLFLLSRYLQQLVMESLGKRLDRQNEVVEQGLTVYGNKGSTDQHAFVQQLRDGSNDFFVTFIHVLGQHGNSMEVADGATTGDFLQGFLLGTRRAMADTERPTMTITVPDVNAEVLGALVALFERTVGLYASLIDVNAYHQPGVEAGKIAARDILALSQKVLQTLESGDSTVEGLATKLQADATEIFYLAEHLVSSGRLSREGIGEKASYRLPNV
ncbi:MAG: glucose-6-phosphate isomerase [Proteobacteria bacterium]|nr:glucose-6-phosphate isomerase [Pseudomonadota bacterium]